MHILKVSSKLAEPLKISGARTLEPGHEYLCTNAFAGAMLTSRHPVTVDGVPSVANQHLEAFPYYPSPFVPSDNYNGRTIWLLRGGGYGDLIMMTPLIMGLKLKWPYCTIAVISGGQYHGLFWGMPVEETLIPIDVNMLGMLDVFVSFEETIESDPSARTTHMVQQFANKCGIEIKDKRPTYFMKDEEKEWALKTYPKGKRKRIAVQFMASCLARSYPHMPEVLVHLLDAGAEVMLFGRDKSIKTVEDAPPELINLTEMEYTFRESIAILSTCDACIAPDSAFVHFSAALDVPLIALYGPFPSFLRITGSRTKVLEGKAPCAPCFFHAIKSTDFPKGMPCHPVPPEQHGQCIALGSIDPKEVAIAALDI